jgi:hypothetical protein
LGVKHVRFLALLVAASPAALLGLAPSDPDAPAFSFSSSPPPTLLSSASACFFSLAAISDQRAVNHPPSVVSTFNA